MPGAVEVTILAIDHVQLAMPPGQENAARSFYVDVLGLTEVAKPEVLAGRGGLWFEHGAVRIHLGVEVDFRPAKKAHPALLVEDLMSVVEEASLHGDDIVMDQDYLGRRRAYLSDPFGNRLELIEP